jgi:ParB/RepB/Spo0J family partition protein
MRNSYATVDPKSLKPSGYNPNMLSGDQRAQLVDEIKRQGRLLKPVVCRDDNDQLVIIDGEHTWQAALSAGLAEIPVELVAIDDFEARRQTFVRNLSGTWHKVRLGRMFKQMLTERSKLSNRDLAAELGVSEGTVRNILLYARAAELAAGREDCPDEDAIAVMGIREVRELIAWLEGLAAEDHSADQPAAAEPEPRILARLKRAWDKATEDERREFLAWTGATADVERLVQEARARGFNGGHEFAKKAEKASAKPKYTPEADARRDFAKARANGEVSNDYAARGACIKAARQERGLSQQQLGELAGVNKVQAGLAERGLVEKSGRPVFAKLEAALGLDS